MTTNLNRWDPWYEEGEIVDYGGEAAYAHAAVWLDGLAVEDWGCGSGGYRRVHNGPYIGVDGTRSPWCDVHVDLCDYRSETPGLMMRGVLEHNHEWQKILDNAIASFTKRMCLVVFTPMVKVTEVLDENAGGLGVPDIAFALSDLSKRFVGCTYWNAQTIDTYAAYGGKETVIRIGK